MRIEADVRVMAYPVRALFPRPISPEYSYTVYPQSIGPQNMDADSEQGWEVNQLADTVHPRPVFVPVNNKVSGEATYVANDWYNTAFDDLVWILSNQGSRMKAHGDVVNTPWVRSTWSRDRARQIHYAHTMSDAGAPGTRYSYTPATSTATFTTSTFKGAALKAQGIYLRLGVVLDAVTETWSGGSGAWTSTLTHPTPSAAKPYYHVKLKLSNEGGTKSRYYKVLYRQTGAPVLYTSPTGADWKKVQEVNLPTGLNQMAGAMNLGWFGVGLTEDSESGHMVDYRIIGGILYINHGGHSQPIEIANFERDGTDGEPVLYITEVEVDVSGARSIVIAMAPMRFAATAQLVTNEQPIGFVPRVAAQFVTRFSHADKGANKENAVAPSDITITPTEVRDPESDSVKIKLESSATTTGTYNGIAYTEYAPMVKAVTIRYPEVPFLMSAMPTRLLCESVSITENFNPGTLELTRSASIRMNNFDTLDNHTSPPGPAVFWGEFSNYAGAFAVTIEARTDYYSDDNVLVASTDWVKMFTGYANLQSQTSVGPNGLSYYTIQCHDRSVSMKSPLVGIPWQDGYNMYYSAAFMASQGGLHIGEVGNSDLAFRMYVPSGPFEDAGDPSGTAYFLPMGTGGSPLMKPSPGITPWEWLQRIGRQAGFMRHFDREGKLQFEKYRLAASAYPYKVFTLYDQVTNTGTYGGYYASAMFNGVVNRDLLRVRNSVTVIGIDAFGPRWDPIVEHRYDDGSVNATQATALSETQANFLGFEQRFVWSDSQFANQAYANIAADEVFGIVRCPGVDVNLQTWLQPDLQLGHRIGVNDIRSGLYDRGAGAYMELMVTSLSHSIGKGKLPTTSIGTMFVPPAAGNSNPFG